MPRALFRFDSAASVADWFAIDDGVMGGVSRSRLRHAVAGHAVFEGIVSLENNGGFASVRSRPLDLGVAGAGGYAIELCGDGKRYKFRVLVNDAFDGVSYQAPIEVPAGIWSTVRLPLRAFQATFRGRAVATAPPLDLARVRQMGFMIADRQAGPFSLELRSIVAE